MLLGEPLKVYRRATGGRRQRSELIAYPRPDATTNNRLHHFCAYLHGKFAPRFGHGWWLYPILGETYRWICHLTGLCMLESNQIWVKTVLATPLLRLLFTAA